MVLFDSLREDKEKKKIKVEPCRANERWRPEWLARVPRATGLRQRGAPERGRVSHREEIRDLHALGLQQLGDAVPVTKTEAREG